MLPEDGKRFPTVYLTETKQILGFVRNSLGIVTVTKSIASVRSPLTDTALLLSLVDSHPKFSN
jgi:hypothetical protein